MIILDTPLFGVRINEILLSDLILECYGVCSIDRGIPYKTRMLRTVILHSLKSD